MLGNSRLYYQFKEAFMKKSSLSRLATGLLIALLAVSSIRTVQAEKSMDMHKGMPEQCSQMMMQKLGKADKNYDLRLMNMMIMHHQHGIMMAKDAMAKAQHAELIQQMQKTIEEQQKEIDQMKAWRKQWYGQ